MADEKKCIKCGEVKPLTEFHRNSQNSDGRAGACKACRNAKERARTLRKRTSTQRTPSGHAAGRQSAMLTVECVYDPTRTYGGFFDRTSWIGTLFDGNWPDGSVWRMAAKAHEGEEPACWALLGGVLRELDGTRAIKPAGTVDVPRLKVIDQEEAR